MPTNDFDEVEQGHPGLSLASIIRTIWKRKIRIAVAWFLFGIAVVVIVHMLPAVYLSEAVILINSQKIPEKFVSATVNSDLEDRISAIRQVIMSSSELKKIIEDFGLYRAQKKTLVEEEILDLMRKDISITLEPVGAGGGRKNDRTGAFRIGYQGSDPVLVTRVTNRLTDLYVDENLKTRETQAAGTSEFLQTQLAEAKKRLDELEASVSAYKLQHNGELPQQEQSLAATLSRLQTELEANRDGINRAQQTRVMLEGSLAATEATLEAQTHAWEQAQKVPDAAVDSPIPAAPMQRKESEVLQQQLEVLRARYKDDHPDVVRLQREIEKLKLSEAAGKSPDRPKEAAPTVAAATRPATPPVQPAEFARTREQVTSLQVQIKGSDKELADREAEQQRILRDLATYQSRLERLPVREQEMAQLLRDYEISKDNYKSLLDKRLAAEMALNMERGQQSETFRVVDRAQVPEKPIKPKKQMLYGLGSLAALVLALIVGMAAELRQDVLLGEWELPEDTTVLARLPIIDVRAAAPGPAWRRWFGREKRIADAGAA